MSNTAPVAKKHITASRSWRPRASNACAASSTRSAVVGRSDILRGVSRAALGDDCKYLTASPGCVDRAHEVPVLGHGLLLKTHGFEGILPREKGLDSDQLEIGRAHV